MLSQGQIKTICEALASNKCTDGILLCGSYAYGEPTDMSDLDIRVVTNDGSYFDSRGLRMFDTDIEIFSNSPERVRSYFEENVTTGNPCAVHFWAHGRPILDRTGIIAQLQSEAKGLWQQGLDTNSWVRKTKWRKYFPQE